MWKCNENSIVRVYLYDSGTFQTSMNRIKMSHTSHCTMKTSMINYYNYPLIFYK